MKKWFFKIIFSLILVLEILMGPKVVMAQENAYIQARIDKVVEEKEIEVMDNKQLYQKLELEVLNGNDKGKKITVENGDQPLANVVRYKTGERVLVTKNTDLQGKDVYVITDFIRTDGLIFLALIFIVLTILIAKWKGLTSVISMIFTFAVIFLFVLPQISMGRNPIVISLIASVFIIPISFYLSHGLNKKTTVAIIGSLITLIITCVLAYIFIDLGKLTGFASEEAGMLSLNRSGLLNMKGILLAGIVIGVLGVLDDITISQAAIVEELANTDKKYKPNELYSKAMNVGKDHITSMVNTLVLAYAGISLPLLLIFIDNPHPFSEIINYEFMAEEIVRTLIGSIGLVLAVPLTTMIAAGWYKK